MKIEMAWNIPNRVVIVIVIHINQARGASRETAFEDNSCSRLRRFF